MVSNWYEKSITWLSGHMLACPIKTLLHIDCPGCGFQRSLLAILKGDLASSIYYYPAGVIIVLMCLFTTLHLFFNFKQGALIIKILFIAATSVILLSYTHRVITKHLF